MSSYVVFNFQDYRYYNEPPCFCLLKHMFLEGRYGRVQSMVGRSVCAFPMLVVKWLYWLPLGQQERAAPIVLHSTLKWVLSNFLILPICKVNIIIIALICISWLLVRVSVPSGHLYIYFLACYLFVTFANFSNLSSFWYPCHITESVLR